MTVFLVYIALLLIIIAARYLMRIYMLAKSIKAKKTRDVIEKEQQLISRIFLIMLIVYMIVVISTYYLYR